MRREFGMWHESAIARVEVSGTIALLCTSWRADTRQRGAAAHLSLHRRWDGHHGQGHRVPAEVPACQRFGQVAEPKSQRHSPLDT